MIVSRTYYYLLCLILLVGAITIVSVDAMGQSEVKLDECSGGTLYYIAYPDTVTNAQDSRFLDRRQANFFFYIYSAVDQQVKIGRVNGASQPVSISAGEIKEFDTKDVSVPLVSVRNAAQGRAGSSRCGKQS